MTCNVCMLTRINMKFLLLILVVDIRTSIETIGWVNEELPQGRLLCILYFYFFIFVCLFGVVRPTRQFCRWKVANLDLYSALMASKLWHWNISLSPTVTFVYIVILILHLAVKHARSLPVLTNKVSSWAQFRDFKGFIN